MGLGVGNDYLSGQNYCTGSKPSYVDLTDRSPCTSHQATFTMDATKVKEQARKMIEDLPDDASWDDLMYRIYVRQAIDAGLRDSDAGRTLDVKEVRARFGLQP